MNTKGQIPRIKEINKIVDYQIFCSFTNGEFRFIDFAKLFKEWDIQPSDIEYKLLNLDEFSQVQLRNGTFSWENIKVSLLDENNREIMQAYEIDPIVLYQHSECANYQIGK